MARALRIGTACAAFVMVPALAAPTGESPGARGSAEADQRPNILWIIAEDHSPMLGVYGDRYADTPTLDALARRGVAFSHAFSNAPVCAPARNTLITGVYAPSGGGHNHDNRSLQPAERPFVSHYLKEAGYWTANIGKYHYNFHIPEAMAGAAWDERTTETSGWDTNPYKAMTKERRKPFFTLVHLYNTHESQTSLVGWYLGVHSRSRGHTSHDPAQAPVPPYYPDTPKVREDIAQYYDNVTTLDGEVKKVLQMLEDEGWAENTVVFFSSDHGNGMPRGKRWLYDSGTRIPLIAYVPPRYQHLLPGKPGTMSGRLVSFVDMAPTILKLAGVAVPAYMQGHAFMGATPDPEPAYVYGHRDRTDERYELIRSVRDKRYQYIHNYLPQLPVMQFMEYPHAVTVTVAELDRLHEAGQLNPTQEALYQRKAPEELYDTESDPYEVHNLAADPRYRPVLEKLRAAQRQWSIGIRDLGLIPEGELQRMAQGKSYFEVTREDERYPIRQVEEAAYLASLGRKGNLPRLRELMSDRNGIVRYWGAMGVSILGREGQAARPQLRALLEDEVPNVRIVAAESLCALGECEKALPVLAGNLAQGWWGARLAAANALDRLDEKARPLATQMLAAYDAALNQNKESGAGSKPEPESMYTQTLDMPWLYSHDNMKALDYLDAACLVRALDKALSDLNVPHEAWVSSD